MDASGTRAARIGAGSCRHSPARPIPLGDRWQAAGSLIGSGRRLRRRSKLTKPERSAASFLNAHGRDLLRRLAAAEQALDLAPKRLKGLPRVGARDIGTIGLAVAPVARRNTALRRQPIPATAVRVAPSHGLIKRQ